MNAHTLIDADRAELRERLNRSIDVTDRCRIEREQLERDEVNQFDEPLVFDDYPDDIAPEPEMQSGLQLINVGDWHGLPVPEREWIVPGWILPRAVTLIAGAGGTGKSLLIQQWLSAIALGDVFLDTRGTAPVPVLYVNCEDDALELHRRQDAIAKAAGRQMASYAGNVYLVARIGLDNPLGIVGDDGKFKPSGLYHEIRAAALKIGAKVVALDNAMQHYVGNLNDPAAVTAFCNALARLALDIDGAVILAGHIAKADGSQFAGTMAWENAVRTRLFLSRETNADGGEIEDSDRRFLTRGKGNYARKGDRLEMVWHAGAFYPESPDNAAQDCADERHEAAFLRCLDEATATHRNASDKPSAAYAPKLFAEMRAAGGSKQRDLERAMQRLFDRKEIIANQPLWRDYKQRRQVYGIVRADHSDGANPRANPAQTGAQTPRKPSANPAQTRAHTPPYTTYSGAGPDGPPPLTKEGAGHD